MSEKKESVGAIWVRQSAAGNEYFFISLEGKEYVAFVNKYKEEEKHPDYRIFPQQERQAKPAPRPSKPAIPDQDIPF